MLWQIQQFQGNLSHRTLLTVEKKEDLRNVSSRNYKKNKFIILYNTNGSSITFNCVFTIGDENLRFKGGYPYSKSFILKNQEFSDYIGCEYH